jgi:hypothetical protein
MNNKKREQPPKPKKSMDAYQRQVRRNQIFFLVLSVLLILSLVLGSLITF